MMDGFSFMSLLKATALLTVTITIYRYISYYYEQYGIRKLGAKAPVVPSYFPLGLDVVLDGFRHTSAADDQRWWDWLFSYCPNPRSKTVETSVVGQRFIFTADPDNIRAILATQFQDYGKGIPFHEAWKDFLGDSIFTTDGDAWHASRQLIRPQFVRERVRDLDIFEGHLQKVMDRIGKKGQVVDIADLFYRYTLDSATDFLLGQPVGSLDRPRHDFADAFQEVQRIQNFAPRLGPLHAFLPKGSFWRGLKVINKFVQPFIESVLDMNPAELQEVKNQTFLQTLAATGTRDRQVIRDQTVAVLLAGRDTTAGGLSFTFLELSRHPEIYAKLRKEILDTVGPYDRPTYRDLKNMSYLQHTMNEVLRLYPGVPMNVRMSLHDTTLPTGGGPDGLQPIGIQKDTPVGYSTIYMQRRADLYPSDPSFPPVEQFCPERWDQWHPQTWHYIPFNGGPRICVGQQFALVEMGYTICRLLQRFERLDAHTPTTGPQFKCEIVISPYNGVQVGFWESEKWRELDAQSSKKEKEAAG